MDKVKNPGFIKLHINILTRVIMMGLPTIILHYRYSHEAHYFQVSTGQIHGA